MRFLILTTGLALLWLSACGDAGRQNAISVTGGDPDKGKAAITRYGCVACHSIPGVKNATALVGPPLDRMALRHYIGGVAENTPENMILWIQNPHSFSPRTAMPNLRVTDGDARDITCYLYTLR